MVPTLIFKIFKNYTRDYDTKEDLCVTLHCLVVTRRYIHGIFTYHRIDMCYLSTGSEERMKKIIL